MVTATQTRTRTASPERWVKAADRARSESIRVVQVASTGQWIATSGTDAHGAYELAVYSGKVRSCTCPAAQHGDPVCKHVAAYHLAAGTLPFGVDAPAQMTKCGRCFGQGIHWAGSVDDERNPIREVVCKQCEGSGKVAA